MKSKTVKPVDNHFNESFASQRIPDSMMKIAVSIAAIFAILPNLILELMA
jgi:hypothetical protein